MGAADAGPGVFEPIPFNSTPVDIKLKQVRPLSFDDPSRFRPDGPNALTSRAYTRDFNEVKRLGRVDSTERTPEQTEIARFWTEQAMVFFNRNLRNLAVEHGLGHARDGAHAGDGARLRRGLARRLLGGEVPLPVLAAADAIQRADTDGNPDTIQDHDLDASVPRQPSGVPVRPRLLHVGR